MLLATLRISNLPSVVVLRTGDRLEMILFGGGPSAKEEKSSGVVNPSMPSAVSMLDPSPDDLRGVVERGGGKLDIEGVRLRPGSLGEGNGDGTGRPGDGGAMIPCDASLLGLGRKRGREPMGKAPYKLLKRVVRPLVETDLIGLVGILLSLLKFIVGKVLSFALRLRKRNKGASHMQTPKNVAISAKPGTSLSGTCPR